MFGVFRNLGCMHRKLTSKLLPFDLKLEKTLRKLKKSKVEQVKMEDI